MGILEDTIVVPKKENKPKVYATQAECFADCGKYMQTPRKVVGDETIWQEEYVGAEGAGYITYTEKMFGETLMRKAVDFGVENRSYDWREVITTLI